MDKRIEKDLIAILGKENCFFSPLDLAAYSYDASKYRGTPLAVILPQTAKQVSKVMSLAYENDLCIIPRGAGTGLTGGSITQDQGIILSLERMNRILKIDQANHLAIVEPGVINGDLAKKAQEKGLFYPPDPASVDFSTIGGNIAENAGGMRAVKYGVTKNFVMGLEVVLPTGEIIHTGSKCIKDVVGYSLSELFVGSEGTLGIITKAVLKLLPLPQDKKTLVALFPTMRQAADLLASLGPEGIFCSVVEFMDNQCLKALDLNQGSHMADKAQALLLMELDGSLEQTSQQINLLKELCFKKGAFEVNLALNEEESVHLWQTRRSLHASLHLVKSHWEEEDISVPFARLPQMLEDLALITKTNDLIMANFGHFGDGNIHISFAGNNDGLTPEQAQKIRLQIFEKTVALEGRIAAEHGIGLDKKNHIGWNLDSATINFMERLKNFLDPKGLLNPKKVFPIKKNQD